MTPLLVCARRRYRMPTDAGSGEGVLHQLLVADFVPQLVGQRIVFLQHFEILA